jgi:iron complex outermembrane receptor protein
MNRETIMIQRTKALRLLAAATALTTVALPQAGFAQAAETAAAEAADAGDMGEIVVTARRREESLIDVPISVSAISGEALSRTGAIDITTLQDKTPNMTLQVARGSNSTLIAFIRGIGQQDPVWGFEPGVGLYVDDVYIARPQGAVLDIFDIDRVEVLRGPQGTLYGRNTIGGAVKYVTRRLGATPELRIRGTVGTYDQADLVVSGSTPVSANHVVRLGGAVARLSHGGFGDNLTTGQENYNKDIWAGRMSLEINNDDNVFVRFSGDLTQDNSNPRGGHRLIPGLASGAPVLDDVYDTQGGLNDPEQVVRAWGGSIFGEFRPSADITLRSITAYRRDRSNSPIDFDALPAVDLDVPATYRNRQTSQELQILYNHGGFNGLVGAYYLDASAQTIFDVRLPGTVTALTFGNVGTQTWAIFGDFTYDFSPQWSVSVGGRYTWDERTSDINRGVYIGGGSPFFGGAGTLILTQSDFTGTATFKEFTPRASISFRPNDDNMIYVSYARGFKGGGFDPRGVSTAAPDLNGNGVVDQQDIFDFMSFAPETVDSYELGWHAQLFDRRLRFSLAAFYADYDDVQVPGSVGAVINGQQTFIGVTTNAGRARFEGVEFEGNARLARSFAAAGDSLNFAWSLGYLNADYKEFIDARGINVADERRIQNTPTWTLSGTLDYGTPVAGGMLNASTTLSYRSASQQFELRTPGLDQPGFALLDANLVWRSDGGRWEIGLHGRNLTNKHYIVAGYNFLAQDPDTGAFLRNGQGQPISTLGSEGVLTAYYGNPRQVFLTVGLNFR